MRNKIAGLMALGLLLALAAAGVVRSHCDTLDGPVVKDAKLALEQKKADAALKWVQPGDEREVRELFAQTLKVRALSPEARTIADRHFSETLVRLHRAGEGMPFTGLKLAGEIEEPIRHADESVESGSADQIATMVSAEVGETVRKKFARVMETKKHMNDSPAAGREYVEAYVDYIHFVEKLHNLIHGGGHGEGVTPEPAQ